MALINSESIDADGSFLVTTPELYTETTPNITYFNETVFSPEFDIDDFLLQSLGPKRLPLNWLIPLTVVYSIIFLTGIVGNICTCLVIARNQYMQTATNCYLFNLAIADMMTLLFVEWCGDFWYQKVSRAPASANDIMNLQDRLDSELTRLEAREIGLCDVRRKLYDQLFDELIRQEIIVCPERGRLLRMIRRETELSLSSLLSCYESGLAYGMKKKLESYREKAQLTVKITELLSKLSSLNDEIRDLEPKVAEVKETMEAREGEKQAELDAIEGTIKKDNESLMASLKDFINVSIDLESM